MHEPTHQTKRLKEVDHVNEDDANDLEISTITNSMTAMTVHPRTRSEIEFYNLIDCQQVEWFKESGKKSRVGSENELEVDGTVFARHSSSKTFRDRVQSSNNEIAENRKKHSLQARLQVHHQPDFYRLSLWPFDWWHSYGGWRNPTSKRQLGEEYEAFFPGLIIARNTWEAEMSHVEELQRHLILVVEAGLTERTIWAAALHHGLAKKFSSEKGIAGFAIAAMIICDRLYMHPDMHPDILCQVNLDWCVSEYLKHFSTAQLSTKLGNDLLWELQQLSQHLGFLTEPKLRRMLNGVLNVLVCKICTPRDTSSKPNEDLRQKDLPKSSLKKTLTPFQSGSELFDLLMTFFDPLSPSINLRKDLKPLSDNIAVLLKLVYLKNLVVDKPEREVEESRESAFNLITALRCGELFPQHLPYLLEMNGENQTYKLPEFKFPRRSKAIKEGFRHVDWHFVWAWSYIHGRQTVSSETSVSYDLPTLTFSDEDSQAARDEYTLRILAYLLVVSPEAAKDLKESLSETPLMIEYKPFFERFLPQ